MANFFKSASKLCVWEEGRREKRDNAEEQLKIERIGNRGIKKGDGGAKGDKQKEESMKK